MRPLSRAAILVCLCLVGVLAGAGKGFAEGPITVTFNVRIDCDTPKGEVVCVLIDQILPPESGMAVLQKTGDDEWTGTVTTHQWSVGGRMPYRYCRNYMDPWSDESFNMSNKKGWRYLNLNKPVLEVHDVVKKWRWWPVDGVVPDIDTSLHQKTPPAFMPRPDFMRGIAMVDFWWDSFSNTIVPGMDKMIANSRANWIQYTPLAEITQYYPMPIIVREGNNGTPEKELIKIIVGAHRRGLKVFLNPGVWAILVKDPSPRYHTDDWWREYARQWSSILTYYASIAEKYKVEMLEFRMWPDPWGTSVDEIAIIDRLSNQLFDKIRKIYRGKIDVEFNPWGYGDGRALQVYEKADYLGFVVSYRWPISLTKSRTPSVQEMLRNLRSGLENVLYDAHLKLKKNYILCQFHAPSFDGAARGDDWGEEDVSAAADDNPRVKIDLQEQADILDAMLYAFSEKDWIAGIFNFGSFYHDSIDKDIQVRGKPSEKVLAKWYKWINPKSLTLTIEASSGGTTVPEPASYVKRVGNKVRITAKPAAGYAFAGWVGNIPGAQKKTNPLTVQMNNDKTLTARFKKITTGSR